MITAVDTLSVVKARATHIDDRALGCLLDRVRKPARYIGGELGRVIKDPAAVDIHVCLAFPDAYEIGMSHLGLRILYALLNDDPRIYAERAYCPFPDMEQEHRVAGMPLFSMESRTPLHAFDVVGFSLQSEMTHTNALTMLDLGEIPLHRWERGEADPLIVAGGPVAFNPEPLSDFFDAFLVGDGEEAFPRFLRRHHALKTEGVPRDERLARLAGDVDGLYVPALYSTRTDGTSGHVHVVPAEGAPYPVRKALVDDVDMYPFPTGILVPQCEIVHDRVAVEIARGCTEGCRFCQAGIIYRPVRERRPRAIVDSLVEGVNRSGCDEASLTALSAADYSCITPLARAAMAELESRRTAMSVSSLRVYGVTEELAREIARSRKTGFTIAPEAGTQRLRDAINKGVTDDDIDSAAAIAFGSGWTRLKLYFMIGLPTETDDDVRGIAETAIRVWRTGKQLAGGRVKVAVSVASFVPKPHSTFQWVSFDDPDVLRRKQRLLADLLRRYRGIELKTHDVALSRLEAVFARGDRRLGRVIESAWRSGARFDEWSDFFRVDLWENAFAEAGVNPEEYLRPLPTESPLVWDHIDSRVTKEHLLHDLRRGLESQFTPACEKPYFATESQVCDPDGASAKLVCYRCGVACDLERIAAERDAARAEAATLVEQALRAGAGDAGADDHSGAQPFAPTPGRLFRYRICYAKEGLSRYLSHLEVARVIERAGRRAQWPVAFSGGFHPHPKLAFGPALPVGVVGENEYCDVELYEQWSPEQLTDALRAQLPEGFAIRDVRALASGSPAIESIVDRFDYAVTFEEGVLDETVGGTDGLRGRLDAKLADGSLPIERVQPGRQRTINAAEFIANSEFTVDNGTVCWFLTLLSREGRSIKPREIVESLCDGWPEGTVITRRRMGRLIDGRLVTPMEAAVA